MGRQNANIIKYENIEHIKGSELTWSGTNKNQICFEEKQFCMRKYGRHYNIGLRLIHTEMYIAIKSDTLVEIGELYLLLCDLRRFQYLFDGAFYVMQECVVDSENYTETLRDAEVGYFQNGKYKHTVSLNITDKEYKKYFSRWLKVEKQLGIINQMILYAGNIKGLTSDVRISMLTECFESLAKKMEKKGFINIVPEADKIQNVKCKNCNQSFQRIIKGRKTLACCLMAILTAYGKPIFTTEYRRRKSLVSHIVKTRNKVFHVKIRNKKTLKGSHSGFYSIKLELLYRYIILLLLGFDEQELNRAFQSLTSKFEEDFPQLIYTI